ncbi:VWA domain-containing protein [Paenibacillus hamazuiensis]|uniref:VWA domain-containing protein n=1 Tax=Paenibacillus hamazuiensis TaxID=2936508 RepID=UPI0020105445|nr:VWA domain-containing protein [Paenibacillus hamazuiensis]
MGGLFFTGKNLRWLMLVLAAFALASGCSAGREQSSTADSNAGAKATSRAEAPAGSSSEARKDSASSPPKGDKAPGGASGGYRQNQIQSGQLTAGEWSDLRHWDWWLNLMNNREWAQYQEKWDMRTYQRVTVEVKTDNGPAVDAQVTLFGGSGQQEWSARTNNKGEAFLFVNVAKKQEDSPYSLKIAYGQQTKTVEQVAVNGGLPLVVNVPGDGKQPDAIDLMFVVDTTGSMADELNFLAAELKDVVARVKSENDNRLSVRLSSNFYRDRGDEYVVRPFPFTADVDEVVKQIGRQKAQGGGDYEEAVEEALQDAIDKHNWSGSARARLLFLVLDAPPHPNPDVIGKLQKVTASAAEKGIRIIPVASSGVDKNTEMLLRTIDILTGGTYIFLTDHSGIGDKHIEPTIGDYQVELLNRLLVKTINSYIQ